MGAREIRIEEVAEAGNFLALRSEDPEKYFLNGGWTIQWNGDYRVAGTTFTYKRTGNWENLTSPGPTVEPVWIQVWCGLCWLLGWMRGAELPALLPSCAGLSCCGPSQLFPADPEMGPQLGASARSSRACTAGPRNVFPAHTPSGSASSLQLSLVPLQHFSKY